MHGNFGIEDDDLSWGRNRLCKQAIETITRLNTAGRRYMLDNPADRPTGVAVLSEVNHSLDCIFLHLQENPSLCDFQQA